MLSLCSLVTFKMTPNPCIVCCRMCWLGACVCSFLMFCLRVGYLIGSHVWESAVSRRPWNEHQTWVPYVSYWPQLLDFQRFGRTGWHDTLLLQLVLELWNLTSAIPAPPTNILEPHMSLSYSLWWPSQLLLRTAHTISHQTLIKLLSTEACFILTEQLDCRNFWTHCV
jgi:hypothetical protein